MQWKEISVARALIDAGSTAGRRSGVNGVICRRFVSDGVVVICPIDS